MSESEEIKEKNSSQLLKNKMSESTKQWTSIVDNLSFRIKGDIKDVIEVQAEAISYRQHVVEEIKTYSVKIYKLVQKMKVLTKQRFEYYATGYQVKTSSAEKIKLIDADLSEHQELINELDAHVDFLRETSKNIDNVNYGIKNAIELTNFFGGKYK